MPFIPDEYAKNLGLEPMHRDVPDHLGFQLWEWVAQFVSPTSAGGIDRIRAVANHMRWPYSEVPRLGSGRDHDMALFIESMCKADGQTLLTVLEYLLKHYAHSSAYTVEQILSTGNSAYTIKEDGTGLAFRTDPTARAQVEDAIETADEGPAHWLTEAWNDAYGREPRPGPSYDASIRAVEGALRGIVIPRNGRATITQIINALRDGRANFVFELDDNRGGAAGANEPPIDGIDTVLAMLRSLAYGQRTRHGASGPVTINSPEEAKVALHLAVTLVQIGLNGALRRR